MRSVIVITSFGLFLPTTEIVGSVIVYENNAAGWEATA